MNTEKQIIDLLHKELAIKTQVKDLQKQVKVIKNEIIKLLTT